jgi:hypothetical protein
LRAELKIRDVKQDEAEAETETVSDHEDYISDEQSDESFDVASEEETPKFTEVVRFMGLDKAVFHNLPLPERVAAEQSGEDFLEAHGAPRRLANVMAKACNKLVCIGVESSKPDVVAKYKKRVGEM